MSIQDTPAPAASFILSKSRYRPLKNMTFDAGVLPIGKFREYEDEYIDLLRQPANKESTAEAAASLLARFNNMWDFYRRGGFYSLNEELDEFSTNSMRFLLIPYYIGRLHLLFQGKSRPEHLEAASAILTAFSEEMTRLGVIGEDKPMPTDPFERRARATAEYRDKKELEDRIKAVNRNSTRDDLQRGFVGDVVDEETERDLICTVMKLCAMEARSMARMAVDELLPPDDETWAQPGKPSPQLDASDEEEAELARKKAAEWDDYVDTHPPFSEM